ncbi:MAG TPA: hypothetical protein VME68_02665 [Acidobacteriaceae bacterium]|nr:hypothetical protein [Acidobacteriaceae bacterium]
MSRIRLTIDSIALQGFDPAERTALIDGLRSQLERTLADREARAAWKSHRRPVLRLGGVSQVPGLRGSRALGSQIARAVGRSMKP